MIVTHPQQTDLFSWPACHTEWTLRAVNTKIDCFVSMCAVLYNKIPDSLWSEYWFSRSYFFILKPSSMENFIDTHHKVVPNDQILSFIQLPSDCGYVWHLTDCCYYFGTQCSVRHCYTWGKCMISICGYASWLF